MKKFLLLLILSAGGIVSHAQTDRKLDSLILRLSTTNNKEKLNVYRQINNLLVEVNPKKDLGYIIPAQQLARETSDKKLEAFYTKVIGFCYSMTGDYDKALQYYLQSLRMFEEQNDYKNITDATGNLASIYFSNRNTDSSYIKKAEGYNDESIAVNNKYLKDTNTLLGNYIQKAQILDELHQRDSGLYYMTIVRNYDFASNAQDRAVNLFGDYSQIGLIYKHKGDINTALKYYDSALEIIKTVPNQDEMTNDYAAIYNNIASAYVVLGNYTKALDYFNTSIMYGRKVDYLDGIMGNYKDMADMFGLMKDYRQQSEYLQKYYALKDSLFTTDKKVKMTQLESDYQLEKKNTSLALSKAETEQEKNQRNIFIFVAAAVLLLFGALVLFYRRIQAKNKQLAKQNVQINQQKEELQTLNGVKDRLFSIISHDLRNPIATLKAYLSMTDNIQLPVDKRERYKQQTQQAISRTGDMLDNLLVWANMQIKNTQPVISTFSLSDCVDDSINAVSLQAAQKDIHIAKELNVDLITTDRNILDIALRNLLTNAIKYSHNGGYVCISSKLISDTLNVSVKDNGVGMTPEQITDISDNDAAATTGTQGEKGSGLGLYLIKELLQKINGQLAIQSEPGKGSLLSILLPLN